MDFSWYGYWARRYEDIPPEWDKDDEWEEDEGDE